MTGRVFIATAILLILPAILLLHPSALRAGEGSRGGTFLPLGWDARGQALGGAGEPPDDVVYVMKEDPLQGGAALMLRHVLKKKQDESLILVCERSSPHLQMEVPVHVVLFKSGIHQIKTAVKTIQKSF